MITMNFDNVAEFENEPWKVAMVQQGSSMKNKNVRKVIFVHGTFTGDDPLGVFGVMEALGVSISVTGVFKILAKRITDKVTDDLGNFTEDYISSYAAGIGLDYDKDCMAYNWSSKNNHIGRLLAVPALAAKIAEQARRLSANDKILLIGHSHAGQLFALLTLFLEKSEKANELFNVLADVDGFDKKSFSDNIENISNISLDIVTLGTPVRYPWGDYDKYRLLNIVNHRSESSIKGVLNTEDGDYVQQWGTDGTDLPPAKPPLKVCNDKLDSVLDKGSPIDIDAKRKETTRRQPFKVNGDPAGVTFLVNYKDAGDNPFKTLLGHGIYTRRNSMLFNTRLIVENFYS